MKGFADNEEKICLYFVTYSYFKIKRRFNKRTGFGYNFRETGA
jgi:hypothetical protein